MTKNLTAEITKLYTEYATAADSVIGVTEFGKFGNWAMLFAEIAEHATQLAELFDIADGAAGGLPTANGYDNADLEQVRAHIRAHRHALIATYGPDLSRAA